MNTNIQWDFQICISVPLIVECNLENIFWWVWNWSNYGKFIQARFSQEFYGDWVVKYWLYSLVHIYTILMVLEQLPLRKLLPPPNPKSNPNLDQNPNPKGRDNCPDSNFYLIFLVLALLGFYVVDWFTWYWIIDRM